MNEFFKLISKNPTADRCVTAFSKDTAELRLPRDTLWEGSVRNLNPSRLITSWLMVEDPLMIIAGGGYKASEVRDKTFELQCEAVGNLRGNRKLTKAKMGDALAALKPSVDQTKIVAMILYGLKQIQTVCFDEEAKSLWTVPEDLRAWSSSKKTLWVDSKCERMLEFDTPPAFGYWISKREDEGWKIQWPVSEGSLEDMKSKLGELGITPTAPFGEKVKKEHWAATLGRHEAIEHLSNQSD
jgi:hypothetical protein